MPERRHNLVEGWHLLSLDAPTVAALWSWFFARAMHLRLPGTAILLLALGTWLYYVADRILDGFSLRPLQLLRERHLFHASHRRAFVATACVLSLIFIWMIVTRMDREALKEDAFLGVFAFFYLFAVHSQNASLFMQKARRLPKELAVGILFAAATAVPAWSRMPASAGSGRFALASAVVCFAVLCWINCLAIEKWEAAEQAPGAPVSSHASTRWAGAHLQPIAALFALGSLGAAYEAPSRSLGVVYLALLASNLLFFMLDRRRSHFSAFELRIAADAALLTPLAFLPIAR